MVRRVATCLYVSGPYLSNNNLISSKQRLHLGQMLPGSQESLTSALGPGECALVASSAVAGVGALGVDTFSTSTGVLLTLVHICKTQGILVRTSTAYISKALWVSHT